MKVNFTVAAVSTLALTGAFCDITVGAWGRAGLHLGNSEIETVRITNEITSGSSVYLYDSTVSGTPSCAGGTGRTGFVVSGSNPDNTIGFTLNVDSNAGTAGVGDQAKIRAELGSVEIQFGKIQLDDLRGTIDNWGDRDFGGDGVKGCDDMFTRFYPYEGMTLALRPVEGLFVGAAVNSRVTKTSVTTAAVPEIRIIDLDGTPSHFTDPFHSSTASSTTTTESSSLADVLKAIQAGAGYTVKDTVQFKTQYIGSAVDDSYGRLEFGTDLLFIKNMVIEIGVKVPLSKDNSDGYFNGAAALSGTAGRWTYKGHVYTDVARTATLFSPVKYEAVPTFGFDAAAEYDLGLFVLGGAAKYCFTSQNETSGEETLVSYTHKAGLELYIKKTFSNGYLFAGAADVLQLFLGYDTFSGKSSNGTIADNTFSIPVGAEYWF